MPPESGGIHGRLAEDLPLGYLQSGTASCAGRGKRSLPDPEPDAKNPSSTRLQGIIPYSMDPSTLRSPPRLAAGALLLDEEAAGEQAMGTTTHLVRNVGGKLHQEHILRHTVSTSRWVRSGDAGVGVRPRELRHHVSAMYPAKLSARWNESAVWGVPREGQERWSAWPRVWRSGRGWERDLLYCEVWVFHLQSFLAPRASNRSNKWRVEVCWPGADRSWNSHLAPINPAAARPIPKANATVIPEWSGKGILVSKKSITSWKVTFGGYLRL